MMMSEQPQFGKKGFVPTDIDSASDGVPDNSDLRHSFAEEYTGFSDDEPSEEFKPIEPEPRDELLAAPIDAMWKEQEPVAAPYEEFPTLSPAAANADPWESKAESTEESGGSFPWGGGAARNEETEPTSFGPRLSLPVEETPAVAAVEEEHSAVEVVEVAAEPATARDELQTMAAQHQIWLETGGKEGKRATFRGDRFRYVDFSGMYLPEASFRGADLRGVRLRAANLSRADFAEADLTSTDFSQSLLDGASFQRAQISHANFSTVSAPETDFSQCEGVGVNFSGARLEWAILREAQLGESDLRKANLTKANLRGASLFRAQAEGVNLSQADCRDANFENAKLNDAILLQANLRMANLDGVNMQTADFTQALEVPAGAVAQSAQQEREWLIQETRRLEILKAELLTKERQLQQQAHSASPSLSPMRPMGRVLNNLADMNEMQRILKTTSKTYMKMGTAWLVMVLAVITVVLNVLSEVDAIGLSFIEILLLGIMLITPLALCLMGVIKSMNLSSRLADLAHDQDS